MSSTVQVSSPLLEWYCTVSIDAEQNVLAECVATAISALYPKAAWCSLRLVDDGNGLNEFETSDLRKPQHLIMELI
ncbi:hypothetical protein [Piscinibacter sp. XHJ-5]|uniref:hypothetical protein n=1 Tax=Piscinibacter sp. XHJ-5 TaxID=3037797 RepID=UPI002452AC7B|nr:hypothetical protein [Piscinibacter sp. XHJ-5]